MLNPEKIKEELANMNYLVEDWGGKYQSQEISAKKGIGVEELLEKVLLEADLLDLKANPKKTCGWFYHRVFFGQGTWLCIYHIGGERYVEDGRYRFGGNSSRTYQSDVQRA